ncbi:hypothetical protein [Methanolobus chelungpuianus]|uniref:Uncharacterized protein n=1 Tax=Methanolobus chelungpuianus TaxID=502115 RepID=A0AAE3HAA7_9EURY|nr:hypothetical protein [Methanolobus chelungpuianus]MCQ6962626.1 hypothetical protein [Methanolobus chelungpuianus]
MAKKSNKGLLDMNPFGETKGPKTSKGQMNKMMTGDGRRNFENLSFDDKISCIAGLGVSKKKQTKKGK